MTNPPFYPEVDISLLTGNGPNQYSPFYPEVDITLLPGVPNQGRPVAYKHTQTVASTTWTINHNLNFYPNVTVFDSAGSIMEGEISHTDNKQVVLAFSAPISGFAALS